MPQANLPGYQSKPNDHKSSSIRSNWIGQKETADQCRIQGGAQTRGQFCKQGVTLQTQNSELFDTNYQLNDFRTSPQDDPNHVYGEITYSKDEMENEETNGIEPPKISRIRGLNTHQISKHGTSDKLNNTDIYSNVKFQDVKENSIVTLKCNVNDTKKICPIVAEQLNSTQLNTNEESHDDLGDRNKKNMGFRDEISLPSDVHKQSPTCSSLEAMEPDPLTCLPKDDTVSKISQNAGSSERREVLESSTRKANFIDMQTPSVPHLTAWNTSRHSQEDNGSDTGDALNIVADLR